jgi:hypothetical protein
VSRPTAFLAVIGSAGILGACGGKIETASQGPSGFEGGTETTEGGADALKTDDGAGGSGDDGGAGPATIQTLASGLSVAQALALDSSFVYFSTNIDETIQRVPLGGGVPTTLATSTGYVGALAVSDSYLYFAGDVVMRMLVSGGAAQTLTPAKGRGYGIAVDSTSVFWTSAGDGGTVSQVAIAGGSAQILASGVGFPYGIAIDAKRVYFTANGHADDGALTAVSINGGGSAQALLSWEPYVPQGLAVDTHNAYVATTAGLLRVGLDGGLPSMLATQPAGPPLAMDNTNIYWATQDAVLRVPKAGGTTVTLASNQPGPFAIAVDATSVYWTTEGTCTNGAPPWSGTVMKRTPK